MCARVCRKQLTQFRHLIGQLEGTIPTAAAAMGDGLILSLDVLIYPAAIVMAPFLWVLFMEMLKCCR
jgi:hypothetical protein